MNVVIIDDQKAMHLIMKRVLTKIDGVEIVGSFQETAMAFPFINSNNIDLVFLDITMPRENGLDFGKRLRESNAHIKIVFVTSHKDYALSAFDVYAFDYIVKPISEVRLRETLQRAFNESKDDELVNMAPIGSSISLIEPLTKREMEIIQLISAGMSNREIAETFKLSVGTVKNHIVNIFGKLQVKNRVQAVAMATELRLIK